MLSTNEYYLLFWLNICIFLFYNYRKFKISWIYCRLFHSLPQPICDDQMHRRTNKIFVIIIHNFMIKGRVYNIFRICGSDQQRVDSKCQPFTVQLIHNFVFLLQQYLSNNKVQTIVPQIALKWHTDNHDILRAI